MDIHQRILNFVTHANWILLCIAGMIGVNLASPDFYHGIIAGGLIVTINFHLLHRTLKKSLVPGAQKAHYSILVKYYIRFTVTGVIIYILIKNNYVNSIGLVLGLSIVVASIMLATIREVKKLLFREAV